MPKRPTLLLSALLAVMLHVDFHLARPLHHRLSLGWSQHWIVTGAVFLVVGCVMARRWPEHLWRMAAVVFIGAVLLAQFVEPVLEVAFYDHRLGYATEPGRWTAFFEGSGAGVIGMMLGLLCARRWPMLRATG